MLSFQQWVINDILATNKIINNNFTESYQTYQYFIERLS